MACLGCHGRRYGRVVATVTAPPETLARLDRAVHVVAATVGSLLLSLRPRYGYHRDELYFLSAGRRLAWGHPDQPPLTALLARAADAIAPGSLVVFRLWSALAIAGVVLLSAMTCQELGGGRFAQVLTAVASGTGVYSLVVGHPTPTCRTLTSTAGWFLVW